jgi:DNA-binding MarR family transcriptional regulator
VNTRGVLAAAAAEREAKETPAEAGITALLLSAVEEDSVLTQRSLARRLGIALGLTNAYLRRCINKGLIKVSQAPANRYRYYLTPKGFAEKSRLTAEFLTNSFAFVRIAREQYEALIGFCEAREWRRLALCGTGELAEIAMICADARQVAILGMVSAAAGTRWGRLPTAPGLAGLPPVDAVILTDYGAPQRSFDAIRREIEEARVLAPRLLNISRKPPPLAE